MVMKITAIVFVALVLITGLTQAQSLTEISRTRIAFGPGQARIGLERSAGEHWKPLFFAVDNQGVIHIPDFYNQRIALFDAKGTLVEAKPCAQGISPRMNFFTLAPNGCYVTFSDGTLFLIKASGELGWQYSFGPAVIPQRIFTTDVALFVMLPPHLDTDGRALVFDYNNSQPLGRFGIQHEGKGIPVVQNSSELPFTPDIAHMAYLPRHSGKYKSDGGAALMYISTSGQSVWKQKHPSSETILVYSPQGEYLRQGTISYPEGASGTGFWTCVTEKLVVYKNYFSDEYMEIVGYGFR
jgi:outer membrane protein assembly factor BamB